jgi:AraC-like DNA-binding protein
MLVGTYQVEGDVSGRLLAALPSVVTVRAAEWDSALLDVLDVELAKEAPGQTAVLDRLLDLVLIAALRSWFARPEAAAPGWYRAASDPVVGAALRLIHHHPDRAWTVASLAREVGASRAAFARRFADVVGEPPISYLTNWRIGLAADLLREHGTTLTSVATEVGYSSPFAFSAAFKRVRGMSPREYRHRLVAGVALS